MPYCKRDDAEIYFEEFGSGFPVLLKDWEQPDYADVQRDTVIDFLKANTPK